MRMISKSTSVFSEDQIRQYLSVICFPQDADSSSSTLPAPTLKTLRQLDHLHLLAFPFDTTVMHYTEGHKLDVSPMGVFQRLVVERRGGSYCFGLNTLMYEVLKGLGYHVYSGGAIFEYPVGPLQDQTKCPHMVLFVQIPGDDSGTTWFIDVGFGGKGLVRPIVLSDDESNIVYGTTPTELHRLRKVTAPAGEDSSTQWWRLEVCHTDKDEWTSGYIFPEQEFSLPQYQHASLLINTVPRSTRFWWSMAAVKYFPVDLETGNILTLDEVWSRDPSLSAVHYGRYTLVGDVVKKTIGLNTEILSTVQSEEERIEMLRKYFGILYEVQDAKHITGSDAAIGSGFVPPPDTRG